MVQAVSERMAQVCKAYARRNVTAEQRWKRLFPRCTGTATCSPHFQARLPCKANAGDNEGDEEDDVEDVLQHNSIEAVVEQLEKLYSGGECTREVEQLVSHKSSGMPKSDAELKQRLHDAVQHAADACAYGSQAECATAWDTVEELSVANERRALVNRALKGAAGREMPVDRPRWTRRSSDPLRVKEHQSDAEAELEAWKQRQGRGPLEGHDLLHGLKPSDTGQTEPPTGSLKEAGQLERSIGSSFSSSSEQHTTSPSPEEQMRIRLLDSEITDAVANAADKCEVSTDESCEEAWLEVEELSKQREHLKDGNANDNL